MKKVKGRKRHIIVDTQGLLLVPLVTAADVNDRTGLERMVSNLKDKFPLVKKLWADMGYEGKSLKERIGRQAIDLENVRRSRRGFWIPAEVEDVRAYLESKGVEIGRGFKVLARRWVVERTFAWICRNRRMSKDYEFLAQTQENMMLLAMIRTILRRAAIILTSFGKQPLSDITCKNRQQSMGLG